MAGIGRKAKKVGMPHKGGYVPRYYSKNKGKDRMELDFVIDLGSELAVLEVKSGKDREYPSLSKVSDIRSVDRRIMFEKGDTYVSDDGVEHYSLFAIAFLESLETTWNGLEF